ncbi:hypothetical protein WMY93_003289 [Mugilogobius chulae]|uniref:Secreted protein n=1 Tax=Mugilogobius chulae TaxID=88201 RepID=A0AAW0PVP9_9GOBI
MDTLPFGFLCAGALSPEAVGLVTTALFCPTRCRGGLWPVSGLWSCPVWFWLKSVQTENTANMDTPAANTQSTDTSAATLTRLNAVETMRTAARLE